MIPGAPFGMLDGPAVVVPPTNWALTSNGGVGSASSSDDPVANAFNGDRAALGYAWWRCGWFQGDGINIWLQSTFSQARSITEVNFFTIQTNIHGPVEPTPTMTTDQNMGAFNFQYWDGSNWVTFPGGAYPADFLVWKRLTLSSPVTTTAIRIHWPVASGYFHKTAAELEAWGT